MIPIYSYAIHRVCNNVSSFVWKIYRGGKIFQWKCQVLEGSKCFSTPSSMHLSRATRFSHGYCSKHGDQKDEERCAKVRLLAA